MQSPQAKPTRWHPRKQNFIDALKYMSGRKSGEITSLKTRWERFNAAGTDGIELQSLVILAGRPGCLSGDAMLYVSRKPLGGGRWYSLKDLYYKFNGLRHQNMPPGFHGWDKNIPTKLQCFKNDEKLTGLHEIEAVYESGVKQVYLIKTESGKSIKTTKDHRFLIDNETYTFKRLEELSAGDFVVIKAPKISKGRQKRIRRAWLYKWMPYYPCCSDHIVEKKYKYHRVCKSRAVYDAHINGLSLEAFVHQVGNNPNHGLKFSDRMMEIHHKDYNPKNDTVDNLQLLSLKEHHEIHNDRSRLGLNFTKKEKILSIENVGEEMTYDIAMKAPYHNFIANEFVVHNSLKSAIKEQIVRDAFENNPKLQFRVLNFEFEMIGKVTAIREFSAATGKSYKYLCSADGTLSTEDYMACYEYAKQKAEAEKYPVDNIDESCTVNEFRDIVDEYMDKHKVGTVYTPTIITVDHSILFTIAPIESGLNEMLMNLGKMLTMLKRKYPVIFIVLSQLNRNVEESSRNEECKYGNYILTSDIYGSDALLMHSDLVIALDRPYLRNLRFYGPSRYIIDDENVLVVRWLKCRNGENQLSFFRIDFNSMSIMEAEPPATVTSKAKTEKDTKIKQLQPSNLFTQPAS